MNEEYVQTACEKHLHKELHAFKYLFFLKVKCGHVYAGGKEVLFEDECVPYYCVCTCVCVQRGIQQACKLLDGWTITHHCYILSAACNLDAIQIFTRGCIAAERLSSTVEDKGVKST